MKNVDNVNVFDDSFCCRLLDEARQGDKMKQRILFVALKESVKNLIYRYYYSARRVGLSMTDLENLCTQAFLKVFYKFREGECPLAVYYRYIYANVIKNSIRDALLKTNVLNRNVHDILYNLNDQEEVIDIINSVDDVEIKNEENQLTNAIIDQNKAHLGKKEKLVFDAYLHDLKLSEIAKKYKMEYRTVRILLQKAKEKTKSYIINNLNDVYGAYNSN